MEVNLMSQLDPRQERSIKKFQESYLSLLESGHTHITIQQLCQDANVSRPTFYNNFTDILDLRKHLHEEILRDLNETLTITNPKPIDAFKENELPENMLNLFRHIAENKQAYEVLLMHRPDPLFIRKVKNILRDFIVDGMKYASSREKEWKDIPFVVSFTTGAYYESIIWWLENNYSHSPEAMTRMLLRVSLHGPFGEND
jgi:AcrR family transcriptional regulator